MTWKTTLLREVKGLADDVVHRVAKQFEGSAETTVNVAKAARMAKRLQTRKAANPPVKPLKQSPPKARMPEAAPKPKAKMPQPLAVKALPKPGPGLPAGASKPRGGQWYPYDASGKTSLSPEHAALYARRSNGLVTTALDAARGQSPVNGALGDWLEKSLTKYYKRDFGAPDDPLRDLAVKGLHYDPDMTPERWQETVNSYLMEDPIGYNTVPDYWETKTRTADREALLAAAPWLAKQPVTDNLYGIGSGGLDLGHFSDEMLNALRPEQSGLPNDLAVDISSLDRMSFPQAVERVGRINQWRAKQMEEAAAARLSSPAVQMYKEYPEAGMRWVELRRPEGSAGPSSLSETDQLYNQLLAMPGHNGGPVLESDEGLAALQEQLKFEGDTMGHCVGGYCDDVASGRSRIFSLRDAKGMPHVTVETEPRGPYNAYQGLGNFANEIRPNVWDEVVAHPDFPALGGDGTIKAHFPEVWAAMESAPDDIVQIKGKQNRAPNPEYLPYVQDFVKSGQWGEIGDLGNTGLVKLPDNRYIRQEDWRTGISNAVMARNPQWSPERLAQVVADAYRVPGGLVAEKWDDYAQYFEGYKRGGRVKAAMPVDLKVNTCGCGGCA